LNDYGDLDRIAVEGINVLGHHGVDEAERKVGQRLVIDVDMYLDLSRAIEGDDIHGTVDYEKVCQLVETVSGNREFLLLESLAAEIADSILDRFGPRAVVVRVRKTDLPISTRVSSVGVEVRRPARRRPQ
jgi:dihydroneopterin aldolase